MKQHNKTTQQRFREVMKEYRRSGKIAECFCHDKDSCNGNIKQSHSIQRNGRLSIIEGDVNGNQSIYTFTEMVSDDRNLFSSLRPIGKAEASTFFGFCDFHDSTLFAAIENHQFDDSDYHCFMHSYRSFAHSYHRKKEELKAYSTKSAYTRLIPPFVLFGMIGGAKVAVKEIEIYKQKMDDLLELKDYSGLEYFTLTLPRKFPLACSSIISPPYSYRNSPMNNHGDPTIPFSQIMLTILPDHDKTIIILACFPDDIKAIHFMDELVDLYPVQLEKAISSILITCAENTFFAPALWEKLGANGQKTLCAELQQSAKSNATSFVHSKINFFDDRFSAGRLGIN
ncbi:hypothetical protein [Pedobacter agri]|uniref:hypothetical protein n=1 Tax=Pedobacter agri TaxID=454586 RepID=UPI00292F0016|nr:hypothetical protein [Pedobacter agri]